MRAKDKSFNADFKTEFDETLPKINIVPQDIGRVILNLINNAFYACTERSTALSLSKGRSAVNEHQKLLTKDLPGFENLVDLDAYEPSVSVSTKKTNDKIEIKVADNGPGIPTEIKDKIFQPFFTTKPSGKGTGLGLSLSYDIIKAHDGELRVESEVGKGSEFAIILPFERMKE